MFIVGLLLFGGALFLLGMLVFQAYVRSLGWERVDGRERLACVGDMHYAGCGHVYQAYVRVDE